MVREVDMLEQNYPELENIFGKEFNNVCNAVMAFYIPNAETLEYVEIPMIL